MKITETCACGGIVTVDDDNRTAAANYVSIWRAEHQHLAPVGICGDPGPRVVAGVDQPPFATTICSLAAGHTGWHGMDNEGYGKTSWMQCEHIWEGRMSDAFERCIYCASTRKKGAA